MNDIFVLALHNSDSLVLIDVEDRERVLLFKWRISIAQDSICRTNPKPIKNTQSRYTKYKKFYLQNFILNCSSTVDHKNRLIWDNRKSNLRQATQEQNNMNRSKYSGSCSSKYKGVNWSKADNRWRVRIAVNKLRYEVGFYKDEIEAAKAYNEAAIKHHKEFAVLNQI